MSMDGGARQPDDGTTDADVEWAFLGAHDIEYWVVRDGRLVPACGDELDRIAEWERERRALPRLRGWEGEQAPAPARVSGVVARLVWWCRGLVLRAPRMRRTGPPMIESSTDERARSRSDMVRR